MESETKEACLCLSCVFEVCVLSYSEERVKEEQFGGEITRVSQAF